MTAISTPARRGRTIQSAQARAGWILLAPALIHSAVFIVLPLALVVWLSVTDARIAGRGDFVGLENYIELITSDKTFHRAFLNTVLYSIVVVPVAMALALLIAVGLNQRIHGRGVFRTVYYIPVVTSGVAVSAVWLWIYSPSGGLANEILAFFGLARSGWLTDPNAALPALMVIGVWQGLGTKIVLYLAALQSVSFEQLEAAQIDGANRWQSFWNVTWPALAPVHFFVLVTSITGSLQVFDLVYVMTGGGPGDATNVLVFDIFNNAFARLHIGYASAETVLLLFLIGAMVALGRLAQRDKGDY